MPQRFNSNTMQFNQIGRATRIACAASTLAIAVAAFPQAAQAACLNVTVSDVECSGPNPNTTVTNSGAGARSTTVTQGASVASGTNTINTSASGGNSIVVNDGTVSTDSSGGSSDYAAIIASANTGTASINNSGSITGTGANVMGARFIATNGIAQLTNSGAINASGAATGGSFGPRAVAIFAASSDVSVTNSGTITNGGTAGVGIAIDFSGTGETSILNTSSGVIEGYNTGLYIRNALGPVQIENAGAITRRAADASGFLPGAIVIFDQSSSATGTQVIINNSGTIDGGGSNAIRAIQGALGVLEVTNSGTIAGGIVQFGGLSALIDNSGTINGDVQLGSGDGTVILRGPNAALNGFIDGGSGTNTLRFIDANNFTLGAAQQVNNVQNFEVLSGNLSLDGADLRLFGPTGSFTTAGGTTITSGGATSVLFFNDGGTFTNNGTLVVQPGSSLQMTAGAGQANNFVSTSGSTVRFVLDTISGSTVINGRIGATNITFDAGSQIDVDVRDLNVLVNGRTLDIATATDTLTDNSGAVTDNSILFDFSKSVIGGNTLRLTMQQLLSIADTINSSSPNSGSLAGALQSLIDSGSTGGNAISTLLGSFSTANELAAAVDDFAPDSSNMLALSALSAIEPIFAGVRERQESYPLAEGDVRLWSDGGLFSQSLDSSGFFNGYDSNGWHLGLGAEGRLGGPTALVVGLGYDHVDGSADDGTGGLNRLDQKSDRFFLYTYLPQGPLRFNAALGFGRGRADASRSIPVLGDLASASFDTKTSFGRAELGYAIGDGDWQFTPTASIQFANINSDAFAETGSDGALTVAARSVKSAKADIGLAIGYADRGPEPSRWSPSAAVRYAMQLRDLYVPLSARFNAGGNSFAYAVNDLPGSSVETEISARFAVAQSITLGASYRGSFADRLSAHAGLASISIGF